MKNFNLTKRIGVSLIALSVAQFGWAETTLKFAHVYEVDHPLHKGAEMAAEQIKEATEGRVIVEVFPASALGKEDAINEGLTLGTVDIIYTGAGFAGTAYGPISMTDFPFTLRGLEHWANYRDSDLFKELAEGYKDATGGNEVEAISYYGSRQVTSNKPILTPEDMQGLKIRVPNAPAYMLFPEAVGANPTPMAFSEVYLALQQGVVDAQENPLPTIKANKFYEVQSDINLTSHITNSTLTIASSSKLDSLGDDREAVVQALKDTANWVTEQIQSEEAELVQWFKDEGNNVNEVDRAPFIEAVKPHLVDGSQPFTTEQYEALQAIPGNE